MEKRKFICPEETQWDHPLEWVWCHKLGFCGCYNNDLPDMLHAILADLYYSWLATESDNEDLDYAYYYQYQGATEESALLQELILHILDSKDLTEHGTAVRGCWLTDEGAELCDVLFSEPWTNR